MLLSLNELTKKAAMFSCCVGAENLGYPGVAHGLFPKGGIELVHHFYRRSNSRLSSELPTDVQQAQIDLSK